jgi:hypothetical protein
MQCILGAVVVDGAVVTGLDETDDPSTSSVASN